LELNYDLGVIDTVGQLTAVVLFIHRRNETTKRVFASISQFKPERLYIFADGARAGKGEERFVRAAREETETVNWDCVVLRYYSEENHGLSQSILNGLDIVFRTEGSAIILEDDCLPSSSFFSFAEQLLEQFEHSEEVAIISGTNLSGIRTTTDPYMFTGHPYIWGWATWATTWQEFRSHVSHGRSFSNSFAAIPGVFSKLLFWNLLLREVNLNSWDIPFAKYIHAKKTLCITPAVNLIENIGFGAQSTHTDLEGIFASVQPKSLGELPNHPLPLKRNRVVERHISKQLFRRLIKSILRDPALLARVAKRAFASPK
jgi:hypothetical protein